MKFIVIFVLFYTVCGNEEDFRIIDSIKQEKPCIEAGGICTVAADCPTGLLAERQGLCSSQKKQGIECCYHGNQKKVIDKSAVSVKETRCNKHGGECMKPEEYCNPRLIFNEATDCSSKKCCILTL